ncbi:AAA family ATPase [Insolitispirillum peregrinum]|uniref:AAA family ATPase n=1 Tax=Insolitispirillum peregrinum TaxID=80876 RepID=UPI003609796B
MIAKRVPTPEGGGRGFVGLQEYIEQAHKAVHTFFGGVSTLETAAEEMQAVADVNSRANDPLYHLILSWPEFEKPTPEQAEEAVRAQLKALGFEGHQYIAAVHNDTPDRHVHVAINRVHPETFRVHHPRGDFYTLDRTCREIELAQGWTHDRGPHVVEYVNEEAFIIEVKDRQLLRSLSEGAKKVERFTGEVSLERYLRDNEALKDRLDQAKSWQEIHDTLRLVGLRLEPAERRTEGFVISETVSDTHAKASFTLSAADTGSRLGPYQGDSRAQAQEVATILQELTRDKAVFTERDIDVYLKEYVSPDQQNQIKAELFRQAVHLVAEELPGKRTLARFTTREVLAEEEQAQTAAAALRSQPAKPLDPAAIEAAIAKRTMRPDQLDAFRRGLQANGIGVVQGRAGTGKSYMMSAWMEAHRDSGHRVIGLAPTNIVAQAMIADGFTEGKTVDSILHAAKKGLLDWDANTVLILDEAGMVSNDRMKTLLELAAERGAKILMVGDDRQLPAVERGGLFADLGQRYPAGELTVITRQKEAEQNKAATHFSRGEFEQGMRIYAETGRLHITGTDAEAREALLERWKSDRAAHPDHDQFIATYANADVAWFNDEITRHLISTGAVTDARPLATDRGEQTLGIGSDILFTATNKKLGVANGSRGTVTGWGRGRMYARLKDGTTVAIPLTGKARFGGFAAGYAGTTYKSQGATIDRVYAHHTNANKDAAAYVALTRQKHEAVIFSARETAADWREMARQMARVMTKTAASSLPLAAEQHQPQPLQTQVQREPPKPVKPNPKQKGPHIPNSSGAKEQPDPRQDWEPALSKASLHAEYEADKKAHSARLAVEMAVLRTARDKALAEVDATLAGEREQASRLETSAQRRQAEAQADRTAKAQRAAIRKASRRDGEALQQANPFPASFEDWLRRQDRDEAREVLRQITSRRDCAKTVKPEHLVDPCKVMESVGERHGWTLRTATVGARIYRAATSHIAILTDANGTGLRWLDMVGQKTGSIRRLVATVMGKDIADSDVKAETSRLYAEASAQALSPRATLHAADRRRLDATDLRQGWEQGTPLSAVPTDKDSIRIGPLSIGELRTMPAAEHIRLANLSTTGDRAAAVIVPARDGKGEVKGFNLMTGIGHFRAQGQKPMLTVLGDVRTAKTVVVAYDLHTAAEHWKTLKPEDRANTAVILTSGSKYTLRDLKQTLQHVPAKAAIQLAEPKTKALAGAMDGAKAVIAGRAKVAGQQKGHKPDQGIGL